MITRKIRNPIMKMSRIVMAAMPMFCVSPEAFAATHRSNGNAFGPTDVGTWYHPLYDTNMWYRGAAGGGRGIRYRPLCPATLNYQGSGWIDNNSASGFRNNDCHSSRTSGDYVEYTFYGSGIKVIGDKNTDHGKMDVYIDGVFKTTVDTYSATWVKQQELYVNSAVTPVGKHVIRVAVTGTKNSSSTDYWQSIDAFEDLFTYYPSTSVWLSVNDDDPGFRKYD